MKYVANFFWLVLSLFLVVLPLQTRLILIPGSVRGVFFEYPTVSIYGTEILAWFLVVMGSIRYSPALVRGVRTCSIKNRVLVVLSAGLLLVSAGHGVEPWLSFYTLYRWCLASAVGIIVWRAARERYQLTLGALWGGGVVQALLGLYQFFSQSIVGSKWLGMSAQLPQTLGVSVVENSAGRWLRAYGSFGWPTSLGMYLALALVLGALLMLATSSWRMRLTVLCGELVLGAGLFVTFARGAWLADVAGFMIIFVCTVRSHWRTKTAETTNRLYHLLILCGAFLMVVAVYGFVMRPLISSRITSVGVLEERSITERVSQYHDALLIIKRRSFLGVGPGAYSSALQNYFPGRTVGELQPVHNVYFLFVAQNGVPVAMLLLGVFGCALWRRRKNFMLMAPLATLLIAGLFDHWLLSLWGGLLTLAVATSISLVRNESDESWETVISNEQKAE